ncbi:lipoprotein [Streptomyces fumigatiscleroticus]|nr:lipoprotein [Streptomyces fumigatiscleroticus]
MHRNVAMRVLALAAVTLTAVVAAGCSRDAVCPDGRYPVKAVGNKTGRTCVDDGDEPPEGYVRYPRGKVPQHVGDKWDTYWSRVVVDADGHVVEE